MNHNTHFIVKNLNGTKDHKRTSQSWLDYYRKESGSNRTRCAVMGCSNPVEVGAHIYITDRRTKNKWYIAPFCKGCNHPSNTNKMQLKNNVHIVPATKKRK